MENFCVFIPQLYSIGCIPFFPINVFVLQEILKVIFDDDSAIPFRQEKRPTVLHSIKEEDELVAMLY